MWEKQAVLDFISCRVYSRLSQPFTHLAIIYWMPLLCQALLVSVLIKYLLKLREVVSLFLSPWQPTLISAWLLLFPVTWKHVLGFLVPARTHISNISHFLCLTLGSQSKVPARGWFLCSNCYVQAVQGLWSDPWTQGKMLREKNQILTNGNWPVVISVSSEVACRSTDKFNSSFVSMWRLLVEVYLKTATTTKKKSLSSSG